MASTELESLTRTDGAGEESLLTPQTATRSAKWELFAILAVLAVLVVIIILVFLPYGNAGFAEGYDTLIHFFKVDETLQMFKSDRTYVDWSDKWYNGYPRFLFYPPLFYAVAAASGLILQSLEQASRVMLVAGVLTATFFSYLLIFAVLPRPRLFWHRAAAAGAGAITYALSPALLSFIIVRGKYPDYWALALAPLALFFLVRWLQTERNRIPAAFAAILALILITHIDSAVVTAIVATVFSIIYLRLSLGSRGRLFNLAFNRPLFRLLFAFLAFTALTAFFWLPYLGNIGSIGALQQLFPSRQPLPFNIYWQRGALASGITRYPGMVALFLVLAAQIFKRTRIMARSWLAVAVTGAALSMATYTLIVRELPAVNTLFYRSGMAIAMTAIAALVGITAFSVLEWDPSKLIKRLKPNKYLLRPLILTLPAIVTVILVAGIAWDYSFIFARKEMSTATRFEALGTVGGASDFLRSAKRRRNGRVLIVAESLPKFTFLPSVIDKPIVNGYEGQASRTSVEVDNLLTKDLSKEGRRPAIFGYFNKWNVQYVLIDTLGKKKELANLNESGRFNTVYEGSRYHVLSYEPAGYVQPVQPVLVIGAGVGYPRNVLADMENTNFVFGDSNFVEDYSLKELSRYQVVLLYDFECYDIIDGRRRLRDYANRGGRLLISSDGSLSSLLFDDTFLGVSIKSRTFRARPSTVTGSIGGPKSAAMFNNNRNRWYSDYFSGDIKPLLVLDGKYPIIAKSKIGKGEAIFVGYNFFYHSMVEKDRAETALLRELAAGIFPSDPASLKYGMISEGTGNQSIRIQNKKSTWAMVSMSWSPYWQALEDGKPLDVRPYGNQLAVYLPPGDHQVSLVYRNTPRHILATYVSIAAWMLVLVTPLIRRRRRRLQQPVDVEDESYLADRAALQPY